MIQFTAHCLKKSDALWEGKREKYLNLPAENLSACFIGRQASLLKVGWEVLGQGEDLGSLYVWKFDLGTFKVDSM